MLKSVDRAPKKLIKGAQAQKFLMYDRKLGSNTGYTHFATSDSKIFRQAISHSTETAKVII